MAKSNHKAAFDVRRTLTPAGAKIVVGPDGFQVKDQHDTVADVRWNRVQAIFAYTRFIGGSGALCLAFVLPPGKGGEEDQVVVNENVEGWERLHSHLTSAFPALDNDWVSKATLDDAELAGFVPQFTANPVTVWSR